MQIRSVSNLRRMVWPALGIVLLYGAWSIVARHRQSERQAQASPLQQSGTVSLTDSGRQAIQLQVAPVEERAFGGVLKSTGSISIPADRLVKISPRLQGRVQRVHVNVGDAVRVGQTLAVLDSVDAANATNSLQQSQNKCRLAKENLDRQERLYRLGTPDVSAAEANLVAAKQRLEQAKVSLDQQVASAQANLDQANERLKYAKVSLAQQQEQAGIGGFTQKPLADAEGAVVAARTSLRQAEADYSQAKKELDRTRNLLNYGIAAERDMVSAQDVFDKAKSSVDGARETLSLAEQSLERERKAFKSGLYANQQMESARATKRQAEVDQHSAERALQLARDSGRSGVRQAELDVQAGQKTLQLARAQILRDLLQARADYLNARLDRETARRVVRLQGGEGRGDTVAVTSPIAGTVIERNVNPGQIVDTSTLTPWQMFTIANYDYVWVVADVYEKDLSSVRLGQPVSVHVASLQNREFTGSITYINPTVNPASRTVKVRSEILNVHKLLKDGMFADVVIHTGQGPRSLYIPVSAVQVDGDEDFVFVETPDHKYQKRTIHCGPDTDGYRVVREGLRVGERVVTHGGIFLAGELRERNAEAQRHD